MIIRFRALIVTKESVTCVLINFFWRRIGCALALARILCALARLCDPFDNACDQWAWGCLHLFVILLHTHACTDESQHPTPQRCRMLESFSGLHAWFSSKQFLDKQLFDSESSKRHDVGPAVCCRGKDIASETRGRTLLFKFVQFELLQSHLTNPSAGAHFTHAWILLTVTVCGYILSWKPNMSYLCGKVKGTACGGSIRTCSACSEAESEPHLYAMWTWPRASPHIVESKAKSQKWFPYKRLGHRYTSQNMPIYTRHLTS